MLLSITFFFFLSPPSSSLTRDLKFASKNSLFNTLIHWLCHMQYYQVPSTRKNIIKKKLVLRRFNYENVYQFIKKSVPRIGRYSLIVILRGQLQIMQLIFISSINICENRYTTTSLLLRYTKNTKSVWIRRKQNVSELAFYMHCP